MAEITLDYKNTPYKFMVDNADELLEPARKALGIKNLELADLGLAAGEKFTKDKAISLTVEVQVVRGKAYIIRKSVNEEKGSNQQPANENGELHQDNAVTLLAELEKEQLNKTLIEACLLGVTKLILPDCHLDAQKLQKLAPFLSGLNLTEIDLGGNTLGDEGAATLATVLKESGTLSTLNISRSGIKAQGAIHILQALKTADRLTTLDFSGNKVASFHQNHNLLRRVENFAIMFMYELDMLLKRAPNLRTLHLDNVYIDIRTLPLLATSLCPSESKSEYRCPVRVLSLNDNCHLGQGSRGLSGSGGYSEDIQNIAKIIRESPVEELYLKDNQINIPGLLEEMVNNGLKKSKSLKILDMRGSGCTNRGIRIFADVLPRLTLRKLYLYNEKSFPVWDASETTAQKIRDTIAGNKYTLKCIATGLALNRSLIYLDIPHVVKRLITSQREALGVQDQQNADLLTSLAESLALIEKIEAYLRRNEQLLSSEAQFLFSVDNKLLLPRVLINIVLEYLNDDVDYQLSTKIAKFLNKHTRCQWRVTTSGAYETILSNAKEVSSITNALKSSLTKFGMNPRDIITVQDNTVTISIHPNDMSKFERMVSELSTKKKIQATVSTAFGSLFTRKKDKKDQEISSPSRLSPPKADGKKSLPEVAPVEKTEKNTGGTPDQHRG